MIVHKCSNHAQSVPLNGNGAPVASPADTSDHEDPKQLIPELCSHFYQLGWVSGTGGGLSIKRGDLVYCAPSGVQKERMSPEDMFVVDFESGRILEEPRNRALKCSECLPLFMLAFKLRNAGCCIHSHSLHANLVSGMHVSSGSWSISSQEMIKGIKRGSSDQSMSYDDTLTVPVIGNQTRESQLVYDLEKAILAWPETNAVLVENHGVYVWGQTWQQAKSMAECYDYLFRLHLEAVKCGLNRDK